LKNNKHEFALFYPNLLQQKEKQINEFGIVDKVVIQRITSILRLKEGDQFVLFDRQVHAEVTIGKTAKKICLIVIKKWYENKDFKPFITVLLPVLKRDALEAALYSIVALGASTIQLVATEKTRKWQGEKEFERSKRIVIAAAEQAKHYMFPEVKEPIKLSTALEIYKESTNKLFADPEGLCFSEVIKKSDAKKEFLLFVGPEGDLISDEKKTLKDQFVFCKLTPTILKSEQAIALLIGAIRMIA